MSWRQPAHASVATPIASSRDMGRTRGLIFHLHHRDRAEAFEKGARFDYFEFWIVRFKTKEEFVHRGPCTEIRRIEQRVIQSREAAHSQHAEGCREAGPQDGPFICRNNE